jgi:hypothetical protein
MSGSNEEQAAAARAALHDEDVAAHKAAAEAGVVEEPEFHDEGYDPTRPWQTEIPAGSVEHEKELNKFPNATSYSPLVNVVAQQPAIIEPQEPEFPPEEVR